VTMATGLNWALMSHCSELIEANSILRIDSFIERAISEGGRFITVTRMLNSESA